MRIVGAAVAGLRILREVIESCWRLSSLRRVRTPIGRGHERVGDVRSILAGAVLIAIGERVAALGSELLGSAAIPPAGWGVLVALPAFGVVLAMLVARITILRALGRML